MELKQAELNEVLKQQQNLQQVGVWNHLHDNSVFIQDFITHLL